MMVTATPHEELEAYFETAKAEADASLARSGHLVKDEYGPLGVGWQMTVGHGHSGFGMYAHLEEYPEEGSVFFWSLDAVQRDAYAEGRKDEREQWEPVARAALEALDTCDGDPDGYKGPVQWHDEQKVEAAIKALRTVLCGNDAETDAELKEKRP